MRLFWKEIIKVENKEGNSIYRKYYDIVWREQKWNFSPLANITFWLILILAKSLSGRALPVSFPTKCCSTQTDRACSVKYWIPRLLVLYMGRILSFAWGRYRSILFTLGSALISLNIPCFHGNISSHRSTRWDQWKLFNSKPSGWPLHRCFHRFQIWLGPSLNNRRLPSQMKQINKEMK